MCKKRWGWTLILLLIALAAWMTWANIALETTSVSVVSSNLPEAFCRYRIAQVSDLHDAELGKNHKNLIMALQTADPDLIVLTGDMVDSKRTDIPKTLRFAEQAAAIAPTYYVNGNHEALIGAEAYVELTDGLRQCGVSVLEDECATIRRDAESIRLIGLNDIGHLDQTGVEAKMAAMQTALQTLMTGNPGYTIVLSHRPEMFDAYAACGPDLVLSGHAHGGQFRLPLIGGLIAPGQGLLPEYDSGLYQSGSTSMIVSRGVGNSIIPVRFNNRPELIILELKTSH